MVRLLVVAAVVLSACVTPPPPSPLGDGCLLNSDCARPLVCAYRRCHQQCGTDRDCPAGLSCRSADKPFNVCLLDDELGCPGGSSSECAGELLCAPDQVCRQGCQSSADCLPEQVCSQGACAAAAELQEDGGLPRVGPVTGRTCQLNSDCEAPLVCRFGQCVAECRENRDCERGLTCVAGVCTVPRPAADGGLPPGFGEPCAVSSDCLPNLRCGPGGTCTVECVRATDCGTDACCLSFVCTRGPACRGFDGGVVDGGFDGGAQCRTDLDCQDGLFCNGSERCLGGRCTSAARAICDDGNPCSRDLCDEQLRTCSNQSVMPPDEDGDGHFPTACGGTADDCDDHDATVHGGARERCDFLDNDCDGVVDENLWGERPLSRGPVSTGTLYLPGAAPPRAYRVGSSVFLFASADTTRGTIDGWQLDATTLSPQLGPVPLFTSSTPWDRCLISGTDRFGKRVGLEDLGLAPDAGALLLLREVAYAPTSSCCNAGGAPQTNGRWVLTGPTLDVADAGLLTSAAYTGNSCDQVLWSFSAPIATAWNPHIGRWIFLWAVRSGASEELRYSVWDPVTGALATPRLVWPGTPSSAASLLVRSYDGTRQADVAVGESSVLVVWHDPSVSSPRWMLFDAADPAMAQVRSPPAALALTGAWSTWTQVDLALFDGAAYSVVLENVSQPLALARLTEDGSLQTPRLLTLMRSYAAAPTGSIRSAQRPSFSPLGRGFVVASSAENELRFGWGSWAGDAGVQFVAVDLGLSAVEHSDAELVPLDERTVAAFYQDGDLRRLVLECRD